jgi:hypothetical protein
VASSRAESAQHSVPRLNIASMKTIFFIGQPHFCYVCVPSVELCCAHTRIQIGIDMQAQ